MTAPRPDTRVVCRLDDGLTIPPPPVPWPVARGRRGIVRALLAWWCS